MRQMNLFLNQGGDSVGWRPSEQDKSKQLDFEKDLNAVYVKHTSDIGINGQLVLNSLFKLLITTKKDFDVSSIEMNKLFDEINFREDRASLNEENKEELDPCHGCKKIDNLHMFGKSGSFWMHCTECKLDSKENITDAQFDAYCRAMREK